MTLREQIDKFGQDLTDVSHMVNAVHTDIKVLVQQLENHTAPEQPCAKLTDYAKEHFEKEHENHTFKILGYFGGIVIFALMLYEGIKVILEKGK